MGFVPSITRMGKVTTHVNRWTAGAHACLSCDFCIADERELEEALRPVATDAQATAESPASAQPASRMGLLSVTPRAAQARP